MMERRAKESEKREHENENERERRRRRGRGKGLSETEEKADDALRFGSANSCAVLAAVSV
jgi:hypothetical protein